MELDRKTIEHDEEYLRQVSTPIDFENDNYLEYIRKLKEYCATHYCYALAPVQIGIPKRLIYVKNTQQNMDNNVTEGEKGGKMCEDKSAQNPSNAINIANVKPLTVSSNNMNAIPPDYDYNIISNY